MATEDVETPADMPTQRGYPQISTGELQLSAYDLINDEQKTLFTRQLDAQRTALKVGLNNQIPPTSASAILASDTFQLNVRQNLAVHRFNQYCTTKGLLLMHGVGSGKTVTAISMALESFDWTLDRHTPKRRVTIVAPAGIFEQFIDTLRNLIPNLTDIVRNENKDDYTMNYLGKPITFRGFKWSDISKQYASIGLWDNLTTLFNDDVVIMDEAHRLFRPIPNTKTQLIEPAVERRILQKTRRFILMTGTPFNLSESDILSMVRFVDCNSSDNADCVNNSMFVEKNYTNTLLNLSQGWSETLDTFLITPVAVVLNIVPDIISTSPLRGVVSIIGRLRKAIIDYRKDRYSLLSNTSEENITRRNKQLQAKINSRIPTPNPLQEGGDMSSSEAYSELGIREGSKPIEIREAFYKLSRLYHPDKCKFPESVCKDKQVRIIDAYKLLRDSVDEKDISQAIFKAFDILSDEELALYFDRLEKLYTDSKFLKYLESNKEGIDKFNQLFATPDTLTNTLADVIGIFKNKIVPKLDNIDEYVNQTTRGLPGKNMLFETLPTLKIENAPIKSTKTSIQGGGGWFDYFTRSSGIGGALRSYIYKANNMHIPLNSAKLYKDTLTLISMIDVTMKPAKEVTIGTKIKTTNETNQPIVVEVPGYCDGTYTDMTLSLEIENPNTYVYPEKEVQVIYINYDIQQQEFGSTMLSKPTLRKMKAWGNTVGKDISDVRDGSLRGIGNFSASFDTYTTEYDNAPLFPRYVVKRWVGKERINPAVDRYDFACLKFKKMLLHLLLMKTGYMFSSKGLEEQPHLTTKPAKVNKLGKPYLFGDDPYDIENFPSHVDKIPMNDATHHYLPLVWSCTETIGINLFAAFLESYGYSYVVYHAEADASVREREMRRGKDKVYPLVNGEHRRALLNITKNLYTNNMEDLDRMLEVAGDIYHQSMRQGLPATARRDVEFKERQPLCFLIHPDSTEGLDCKFNPAILLMEPPNTYGDYEQLCGRVLRTYSKQYPVAPRKLVYQFCCFNQETISDIYDRRLELFVGEEQARHGEGLFFSESGDVSDSVWSAYEDAKSDLAQYAPSGYIHNIITRLGLLSDKLRLNPRGIKSIYDRLKGLISQISFYKDTRNEAAIKEALRLELGEEEYEKIDDIYLTEILFGYNAKIAILNKFYKNKLLRLQNFETNLNKLKQQKEELRRKGRLEEAIGVVDGEVLDIEDKYDVALKELNGELMNTNSPDIEKCMSIQAVEYKVNLIKRQMLTTQFPDKVAIENAITGKLAANPDFSYIPWFKTFIQPYQANKKFLPIADKWCDPLPRGCIPLQLSVMNKIRSISLRNGDESRRLLSESQTAYHASLRELNIRELRRLLETGTPEEKAAQQARLRELQALKNQYITVINQNIVIEYTIREPNTLADATPIVAAPPDNRPDPPAELAAADALIVAGAVPVPVRRSTRIAQGLRNRTERTSRTIPRNATIRQARRHRTVANTSCDTVKQSLIRKCDADKAIIKRKYDRLIAKGVEGIASYVRAHGVLPESAEHVLAGESEPEVAPESAPVAPEPAPVAPEPAPVAPEPAPVAPKIVFKPLMNNTRIRSILAKPTPVVKPSLPTIVPKPETQTPKPVSYVAAARAAAARPTTRTAVVKNARRGGHRTRKHKRS